jgi:DNA (cytosine-5)-methyltransferase 3A
VEIWRHIKSQNPNAYYLLENVKMKKENELVISNYMGVHPIEINSALVSAQNRKRLYWTNIANQTYGLFGDMQCVIPQPKDKGILLKDVLQSEVDEKYYLSDKMLKYITKEASKKVNRTRLTYPEQNKCGAILANEYKQGTDSNFIVASRGRNPENPKSREAGLNTEQMLEPRFDGKTNCITSVQKDNLVMQIPEATKKGYAEVEDGKNKKIDVWGADYRKDEGLRVRQSGKSGTLAARARNDESCGQLAVLDYKIRRLTPIECERLQTAPDEYTKEVSDSQRYKMLGNGWTVDVITHILKYIK